ncbi:MAG: pirin family protein [Peptoniphilus sp.]|uniref:pirin family protein n=1 Tax=Peptoniphilus sp. TaxID=1971214 RepID=UPI0025D65B3F|nr:pirin family protein [Peptoniphilus sp.]MCI5642642.1 pirin family protein [Peptoniphilus sp.]
MDRKVVKKVQGFRTKDGAGVSLVRVLGHETVEDFDPILMLDSFDSTNPDEYTAGFPMHPHRGIETVSYLYKGKMVHKDTLGNEDGIGDGEVQWMNSGSGIEHEEMVPAADRLLGVQLWLNLPKKEKMSKPTYNKIHKDDIEEIDIDGGMLRLLSGSYKDHSGFTGEHLPLDYYDIHLEPNKEFTIETDHDKSVMIFTLIGNIYVGDEHIEEKTAVKLSEGDKLTIKNGDDNAQVLFMSSEKLNEEVAWAGPIVMNTSEEIRQAYEDLRNGTFIKDKIEFNAD